MEFCPTCANLLQFEMPNMDRPGGFACPTCPYICDIGARVKIKRKMHLVPKKLDPILSVDSMDTAPTTKERCSTCGYDEAAFVEMQTRSADEPATRFYRCKRCRYTWCEY
ncbi:unnamed protein product [Cuscuta campestris]|uniref:DNA-directed RNA polymerase subunit n=1 Tax=Cuscuta campestris TaxID=132261 RepID=A0A484LRJ6_9ASTE|nr:unnamed protein product [Cuscuta campestris]VFQ92642.1 unnamed protein product [Cuscuta campestris]